MDQLLKKIDDLRDVIITLDPSADHTLIKYIDSEVQHLTNRLELNKTLSPDEEDEIVIREHTIEVFKKFYAFGIGTGLFR
jgi:hypothetical protein